MGAAEPPVGSPVRLLRFGPVESGHRCRATTEQEAAEVVSTAWVQGIRSFDTGPRYRLGLSERRLGEASRDVRRSEFRVSSKVGRILVPSAAEAVAPRAFERSIAVIASRVVNSEARARPNVRDDSNFDFAVASDALRHCAVRPIAVGMRAASQVSETVARLAKAVLGALWEQLAQRRLTSCLGPL